MYVLLIQPAKHIVCIVNASKYKGLSKEILGIHMKLIYSAK